MSDDFDPKAYLAAKAAEAEAPFDPKAYLAAKGVTTKAKPDVGVGETFGNKTADALPMGRPLVNALTALGLTASRFLPSAHGLGVDLGDSGTRARLTPQAAAELGTAQEAERPGLVDNYRQARETFADRTAAGAEDNKTAALLGTLAGTGLSLAAPLPKFAVGSGATGRVLSSALTAGAYGGLNGAVNGRADLTRGEVGQLAQDVVGTEGLQRAAQDAKEGHYGRAALDVMGAGGVGGALTGGAVGAGLEGGRRVVQAMGQGLNHMANSRALAALGAMKPELNELTQNEAQALGQYALDKGIVSPLASKQTMAARIDEARKAAGAATGETLAELNAAAAPSERVLSHEAAAQRVEKLADEIGQKPALRNIANKFRQEAENIRASAEAGQSPGGMSLQDFEETIARPYKKTSTWGADLPLAKRELQKLPMALERQVEDAAAPIAQRTGGGALERYQQAKKDYGALAELADITKEGIRRQDSRRPVSLIDAMAALTGLQHGMAHGSAPGAVLQGAAGLLLSKGINRFGDQLAATGGRNTSRLLQALSATAPNATGSGLARILNNNAGPSPALIPALALTQEQQRQQQLAQALRGENP